MKATGVIRRFDDLGRISIPKEIRQRLYGVTCTEGKMMEILYENDGTIILKPYENKIE